jgi:hypothetical protein
MIDADAQEAQPTAVPLSDGSSGSFGSVYCLKNHVTSPAASRSTFTLEHNGRRLARL